MIQRFPPNGQILIKIQFIPVETQNIDTHASINMITSTLRQDLAATTEYHVMLAPEVEETEKRRGGTELIQIVSSLIQHPVNLQTDILIAGLTVLKLLLQHRRVKKLEIKLDDKRSFMIEQADQRVVQKQLEQFKAMCHELETSEATSPLEIKAHISKRKTLAPPKKEK
jgi:hypothetical protein